MVDLGSVYHDTYSDVGTAMSYIGYYVLVHKSAPAFLCEADGWPRRYPAYEDAEKAGEAWHRRYFYGSGEKVFTVISWHEIIGGLGMNIPRGIADIIIERARQERLKSEGRFAYTCADLEMSNAERAAVLGEEFGEVCHEVNETVGNHAPLDAAKLRKELVQVAAVALGWIEGLDKECGK